MTYWVDFSEGGQVRDAYHNLVASFSFINTRVGGRKDPDLVKSKADLLADALNVHEATGLTPSQLQARVAELEGALRAHVEKGDPVDVANFTACHEERGEGIAAPAAPSPAQEHATQLAGVDELAQLVKQLVHALRKAAPSHALPEKALDYMRRQGLLGSPLRTASYTPSTPAGLLAAAAHIQAKACAYAEECGSYDPDTGAFEMRDAAQDHYNTLNELAEEIRLMADEAAPAQAQDAVAVREVLGK